MTRLLLVTVAMLTLTACKELYEEENLLISDSIKFIGNAALKRGCISANERGALFALNGILERRKSTHRIVWWDLPREACNEKR